MVNIIDDASRVPATQGLYHYAVQVTVRGLTIVVTSLGQPDKIIEVHGNETANRRRRPWRQLVNEWTR